MHIYDYDFCPYDISLHDADTCSRLIYDATVVARNPRFMESQLKSVSHPVAVSLFLGAESLSPDSWGASLERKKG